MITTVHTPQSIAAKLEALVEHQRREAAHLQGQIDFLQHEIAENERLLDEIRAELEAGK